jgi:tRNA/tmRNA/rRNA uracil-C5-methylase (TrmA/RlmC/RlmD family)
MSRRRTPATPLSREPTSVVVDGFTHGGEGVARIEGKAVFVPGALPGERAVVRVVDDRARWARAELVEVVEASPARVPTPVADVAAWGGCDLLHVGSGAARELKTRVVREQLQRLGRIDEPPVEACRSVGPDRGYRNHVQLHAAPDGTLGFHRAGSHEVVPAEHCPVMSDAVLAVLEQVGADTGAQRVVIRAHPTTGTAAALLTPGPGPLELPDGAFDVLLEQPDGSTVTMRGDGVLAEQVADLTYRFGATSFFQVNTGGAAAIVEQVEAACGDVSGALTWDLYGGVGLLSLPLARAGAEVVAVEGHLPSAVWARRNAADAGLAVAVLAEPVHDVVRRAVSEPPDVVVLDPPRVGAGEDVVAGLAERGPATIVYVACDVAALARDARHLGDRGYRLVRAVPLDLFPLTHHVEVVATFER